MSFKNLISFEEIAKNSPLFFDVEERPNWPDVFKTDFPLKLEIGFGGGNFLIEMAASQAKTNFIGLDFYHKGIRKTVTRLGNLKLMNARVAYGDARERIPRIFGEGELAEIYVNFPDPWPKKRHAKRRLIKPEFIRMLSGKLRTDGRLRLATDCEPYAVEMLEYLSAEPSLVNSAPEGAFMPERTDLPKTKYEKNFLKLGQKIFYMDFYKAQPLL